METPELADILLGLREQLLEAQRKAVGEEIRFNLEDVEVEIQFAVEHDTNAKFGVKYLVDVGVAGGKKQTLTHKLKLRLTAEDRKGENLKLTDRG